MPPGIAERHAAERQPAPARSAPSASAARRRMSGAGRRPSAAPRRGDRTGRRAVRGRVCEDVRAIAHHARRAAAAARRGLRGRPADCRSDLEAARQVVGGERRQPSASARSGSAGSAENSPASNMRRLASASPSERPSVGAGRRIAIAPVRPGAGVEQHRDDGQVEAARARAAASAKSACRGDLRPEVAAAEHEMPPARVERDVEVRIVRADHRGDSVGAAVKPRHRSTRNARARRRSPSASISCARSRTARRRQQRQRCLALGCRAMCTSANGSELLEVAADDRLQVVAASARWSGVK